MKAKEYAEKYRDLQRPDISPAENKALIDAMYKELLDEMIDLVQKRQIRTDAAFESLKKEFNQKGDAISRNLGGVLKRGWFLMLWEAIENHKKEVTL